MDLKLSTLGPLGTSAGNAGRASTTGDGEAGGSFASDLASMMSDACGRASGASSPLAGLVPPAAASVEPAADRGLAALAKLLSEGLAAGATPEAQSPPSVLRQKPASTHEVAIARPDTPLLAALASLMVAAKPTLTAADAEKVSATPTEVAADPDAAALSLAVTNGLGMAVELGLVARQAANPEAGKADATLALSTLAARLSASVVQGSATTTATTSRQSSAGSSSPLAALNLTSATPQAPAGAVSMLDTLAAVFDTTTQASAPAGQGIVLEGIAEPVGAAAAISAPGAGPQAAPVERAGLPSTAPVPLEIRHPQAPQQLADTVMWHLDQGAQEVRIRLNPEALGPLEVKLRLDGEKVAVRFDMADASVRDVVQTSLPQLSTMLAARGLALDQAQVFSQDRGQPQPQGESPSHNSQQRHEEPDVPAGPWRRAAHLGAVDDYA